MGKTPYTMQGNPLQLTADLAADILPERREWQYTYLKRWKEKTYNQCYCSQQESHRDWTEKRKTLQKNKQKENSAPHTSFITNDKGTSRGRNHKERKRPPRTNQKTINKTVRGTSLWIITLHGNGFNAPTTTDRLAEGIQQQDHYICCLEETHFRPRDTYRLKVRGGQETFHANGDQRKPGITIVISDEIDFKTKTITKNKNGHYIQI